MGKESIEHMFAQVKREKVLRKFLPNLRKKVFRLSLVVVMLSAIFPI